METVAFILAVLLAISMLGWVVTWLFLGRQVNSIHQTALALDTQNRKLQSQVEELQARIAYAGASDGLLLKELRGGAGRRGAAGSGVRSGSSGDRSP